MTLCERNASDKIFFFRLFPLVSRVTAQGVSNETVSVQKRMGVTVLLSLIIVGCEDKKSRAKPGNTNGNVLLFPSEPILL